MTTTNKNALGQSKDGILANSGALKRTADKIVKKLHSLNTNNE